MRDFVRVVQEYCTFKDYGFVTGIKAVQNLFEAQESLEPNKIYFFLDPVTRTSQNSINGVLVSKTFSGQMGVFVKSDLDQVYFNEKGQPDTNSKFTQNIEPLFDITKALQRAFFCDGLEIIDFIENDATDLFDENFDGLIITYKIKGYVY